MSSDPKKTGESGRALEVVSGQLEWRPIVWRSTEDGMKFSHAPIYIPLRKRRPGAEHIDLLYPPETRADGTSVQYGSSLEVQHLGYTAVKTSIWIPPAEKPSSYPKFTSDVISTTDPTPEKKTVDYSDWVDRVEWENGAEKEFSTTEKKEDENVDKVPACKSSRKSKRVSSKKSSGLRWDFAAAAFENGFDIIAPTFSKKRGTPMTPKEQKKRQPNTTSRRLNVQKNDGQTEQCYPKTLSDKSNVEETATATTKTIVENLAEPKREPAQGEGIADESTSNHGDDLDTAAVVSPPIETSTSPDKLQNSIPSEVGSILEPTMAHDASPNTLPTLATKSEVSEVQSGVLQTTESLGNSSNGSSSFSVIVKTPLKNKKRKKKTGKKNVSNDASSRAEELGANENSLRSNGPGTSNERESENPGRTEPVRTDGEAKSSSRIITNPDNMEEVVEKYVEWMTEDRIQFLLLYRSSTPEPRFTGMAKEIFEFSKGTPPVFVRRQREEVLQYLKSASFFYAEDESHKKLHELFDIMQRSAENYLGVPIMYEIIMQDILFLMAKLSNQQRQQVELEECYLDMILQYTKTTSGKEYVFAFANTCRGIENINSYYLSRFGAYIITQMFDRHGTDLSPDTTSSELIDELNGLHRTAYHTPEMLQPDNTASFLKSRALAFVNMEKTAETELFRNFYFLLMKFKSRVVDYDAAIFQQSRAGASGLGHCEGLRDDAAFFHLLFGYDSSRPPLL